MSPGSLDAGADEFVHGRTLALTQLMQAPELLPEAGVLAPMTHWLAVPHWPPLDQLAADGHPGTGPERPSGTVGYRRMFAGTRTTLLRPVAATSAVTRTTTLVSRQRKQGRTGPLTFVTVRHTYTSSSDDVVVIEDVDLVFRPAVKQTSELVDLQRSVAVSADDEHGVAAGAGDPPVMTLAVDQTTLFAFSALSHNPHRIHYDLPYALSEGHPGVVVHGPLKILLMTVGLQRLGFELLGRTIQARLSAPTYAPARLNVVPIAGGPGVVLRHEDGTACATASIE